jgi:hypothetical protein
MVTVNDGKRVTTKNVEKDPPAKDQTYISESDTSDKEEESEEPTQGYQVQESNQ